MFKNLFFERWFRFPYCAHSSYSIWLVHSSIQFLYSKRVGKGHQKQALRQQEGILHMACSESHSLLKTEGKLLCRNSWFDIFNVNINFDVLFCFPFLFFLFVLLIPKMSATFVQVYCNVMSSC